VCRRSVVRTPGKVRHTDDSVSGGSSPSGEPDNLKPQIASDNGYN